MDKKKMYYIVEKDTNDRMPCQHAGSMHLSDITFFMGNEVAARKMAKFYTKNYFDTKRKFEIISIADYEEKFSTGLDKPLVIGHKPKKKDLDMSMFQ
ncbi:unnamed protein product [marine sediment metagenome]|uniref:Uncharacterized protein n=1 Tax=marine sediment metagenome TaxID=412755 RepID=X1HG93_9ZZZZ